VLSIREEKITVKNGIIGVISDTHGLVRPEVFAALADVELIIHAGDIGKAEVLQSLSGITPVLAIRGNNDREAWARDIPDILNVRINGLNIQVIHNVHDIEGDPASLDIRAVISGHSHKPGIVTRDEILFVNPGSAGPRRFKLPVAVAKIHFEKRHLSATLIELKI
jgi:uncharacterized protein